MKCVYVSGTLGLLISGAFQDQAAQGLVRSILRFKEEIGERWRTAAR